MSVSGASLPAYNGYALPATPFNPSGEALAASSNTAADASEGSARDTLVSGILGTAQTAKTGEHSGTTGHDAAGRDAKQRSGQGQDELTPDQQRQLDQLKKRDAEVRQHEQAHLAAAGPYGQGPPKYEYQEGPDGKQYAIGGHVNIETGPVHNDPEATIQKAQVVRRAALAPKEPSQQDRKIAAEAQAMEAAARREVQEQKLEAMTATEPATAASPFKMPATPIASPGLGVSVMSELKSEAVVVEDQPDPNDLYGSTQRLFNELATMETPIQAPAGSYVSLSTYNGLSGELPRPATPTYLDHRA